MIDLFPRDGRFSDLSAFLTGAALCREPVGATLVHISRPLDGRSHLTEELVATAFRGRALELAEAVDENRERVHQRVRWIGRGFVAAECLATVAVAVALFALFSLAA